MKVSGPIQKLFPKAVYYCIYQLKNESWRYNSKIASKVAKLVKKLRFQLKETDVDEMDLISVLVFLKELRDACISIGIHKREATWLVFYFKRKPVSSSLEARPPRKICATGLHDERFST